MTDQPIIPSGGDNSIESNACGDKNDSIQSDKLADYIMPKDDVRQDDSNTEQATNLEIEEVQESPGSNPERDAELTNQALNSERIGAFMNDDSGDPEIQSGQESLKDAMAFFNEQTGGLSEGLNKHIAGGKAPAGYIEDLK